MPELPEVETTCRGIAPYVTHSKITQVITRQPKLRWPIPKHLNKTLINQTIIQVSRRAKYINLHFSCGTLIIHLGMSGRLSLVEQTHTAQKHDHFELHFSDKILRLTDPRRFGAVLWCASNTIHPLLNSLGPEPLSSAFSSQYFHPILLSKKSTIKSVLLDQKWVVGIGNIYASEALHISGISPLRTAKSLSKEECKKLVQACKNILKKAIKAGGTTLKDFKKSDGKPGYFKQQLNVYGRAKAHCMSCQIGIIEMVKVNQRSTFYCPSCQK